MSNKLEEGFKGLGRFVEKHPILTFLIADLACSTIKEVVNASRSTKMDKDAQHSYAQCIYDIGFGDGIRYSKSESAQNT